MQPIEEIYVAEGQATIINQSATTAEVVVSFFAKGTHVCTTIFVGTDIPCSIFINRDWGRFDSDITDIEVLAVVNAIVLHSNLDDRGWIWKSVRDASIQHIKLDSVIEGLTVACGDDS